MTATDVKERLELLETERALAHLGTLAQDPAYMADLEEEIAATRHAYIGSAVVEIAHLRAAISGSDQG
jgi:septum formation topological specificity factor MinE